MNIADDGSERGVQSLIGSSGAEGSGIRFYLRKQELPPRLLAVVRICVMTERQLFALLHRYSPCGASGQTSAALFAVMTSSQLGVGAGQFPYPSCDTLGLNTLLSLLQAKVTSVSAALERIQAETDTAVVASYRYQCALAYVRSQLELFKHAFSQVRERLTNPTAPVAGHTVSAPSSGAPVPPSTFVPQEGALADAIEVIDMQDNGLHGRWVLKKRIPAGHPVCVFPASQVLSTLSMRANSSVFAKKVIGVDPDVWNPVDAVALLLLHHVSLGEKSPLAPFVSGITSRTGFGMKAGGDKKVKKRAKVDGSGAAGAPASAATASKVILPLAST